MEKLRSEIALTFNGTTEVTRSDLRKMNYLQNVLKESKATFPQSTILTDLYLNLPMQPSDFILPFQSILEPP